MTKHSGLFHWQRKKELNCLPMLRWRADVYCQWATQKHNPGTTVGWIIDRNVNLTNICFSQCTFCNFCRKKSSVDGYVTSTEEYISKIDEMYSLGGDQLLLQGGMNPELGLSFYTDLFRNLRNYTFSQTSCIRPPEVVYLAKKEKITFTEVLEKLIEAGLDSLPEPELRYYPTGKKNCISCQSYH